MGGQGQRWGMASWGMASMVAVVVVSVVGDFEAN